MNGRVDLLMHPLTQKYLEMKWKAYGRHVHMAVLFIYLLFLAKVTLFSYLVLGNNNPKLMDEYSLNVTNSSDNATNIHNFTLNAEYKPQVINLRQRKVV